MGCRAIAGQAGRDIRRAVLLGVLSVLSIWLTVHQAVAAPQCSTLEHDGDRYALCVVDLRESELRLLFWQDAAGEPFVTFAAVNQALALDNARLSLAMNAGMYDLDYAPIGLYVEDGRQLVAANTNEGPGNFHLLPNGVFYWSR